MNINEILSQEEIGALVQRAGNGMARIADDANLNQSARPYDLASEDSDLASHLGALDIINDRFSRTFRVSLMRMLRYQPNIEVAEVEVQSCCEFMQALNAPTSLNVVRIPPLRGSALIIVEPQVIVSTLDSFFGGAGHSTAEVQKFREFTPSEVRVIHMILEEVFRNLSSAWAPIYKLGFNYINSEVNPQFVHIVEENELLVITSFTIELSNDVKGCIQVVYPYASLKPIKDILRNQVQVEKSDDQAKKWRRYLKSSIDEVELTLTSDLAYPTVSLQDLMSLKEGDIIPIKMPRRVVLKAEGVSIAEGVYGNAHGHAAIKIVKKISLEKEAS